MSSKKKNEFREKDYSRNSDGLKQRRLKDESRWRFNPNQTYQSDDDFLEEEDSLDSLDSLYDPDQEYR